MRGCTRRRFLQSTLASAGVLAAAPSLLGSAASTTAASFKGTDIVSLGKTGIRVSRLAQGTGMSGYSHSSAHTRQGKPAFDRLMRHSLDQGIRFIDMADLYGSHPFVKDIIRDLPRDQYTLLTKLWPRTESWVEFSGGAKPEVERFRRELGVDQIDVCLIHCMLNDRWPTEYARVCDELAELKDKQLVRAVGVSCHDLGALKVAAQHPWVDVIMARINHLGGEKYKCDAPADVVAAVLKTARTNGKAVIGMKIFGEGTLVQPAEKAASLNYVSSHELVDAITVGMLKVEEVDDTLRHMAEVGHQ